MTKMVLLALVVIALTGARSSGVSTKGLLSARRRRIVQTRLAYAKPSLIPTVQLFWAGQGQSVKIREVQRRLLKHDGVLERRG